MFIVQWLIFQSSFPNTSNQTKPNQLELQNESFFTSTAPGLQQHPPPCQDQLGSGAPRLPGYVVGNLPRPGCATRCLMQATHSHRVGWVGGVEQNGGKQLRIITDHGRNIYPRRDFTKQHHCNDHQRYHLTRTCTYSSLVVLVCWLATWSKWCWWWFSWVGSWVG